MLSKFYRLLCRNFFSKLARSKSLCSFSTFIAAVCNNNSLLITVEKSENNISKNRVAILLDFSLEGERSKHAKWFFDCLAIS